MARSARSLLALALLLPGAALAQSAVGVNPNQISRTDCQVTTQTICPGSGAVTSVAVNWTYGGTINTGDRYRIFVPSSSTTSCPTAPGAAFGGSDIIATSSGVGTASFAPSLFQSASGASCTAATDTGVLVCVYLGLAGDFTTSPVLVGSATLLFQTAVPPAPVNVTAQSATAALIVGFTPGQPDATFTASSGLTYRVQVLAQGTSSVVASSSQSNQTSGIRVEGLQNDVTYDVVAYACSAANNPSPASATAQGTPRVYLNFWQTYQLAGGVEQGGCGSGGTGALAPLLAALALLRRRRA